MQQFEDGGEVSPYEARINQIMGLDEERRESHQIYLKFKERIEKIFYKVHPRVLNVGYLVLLWDNKHEG